MPPRQSYILCATPRSGSTLLCDMLLKSGLAGDPHSFYREEDILDWADYWTLPARDGLERSAFERLYLDRVLHEGTGANGVFGLRLMQASVAGLCAGLRLLFPDVTTETGLLEAAFGPVLYVHLSRRDKVAQAVSWLKAEQSGLWHRNADGSERERVARTTTEAYDPERLQTLVAGLEADDAAWDRFFADNGIAPLRLVYETMTENPRAALASVLQALGLDAGRADAVEVGTAKLADQSNREWAERFRRGVA